jgi:hypothetical protein
MLERFKAMVTCLLIFGGMTSCGKPDARLRFGEYVGSKGDLTEVVLLKENGSFEHRVLKGSDVIILEDGSYKFVADHTVIFDRFTQVYDPMAHKMDERGKRFPPYELTYFRYDSFSELKDDLTQDYALKTR